MALERARILAPALIAFGAGACLVSFEDYPVASADAGAGASGLGGAAGAVSAGGSAGWAGAAGAAGAPCTPGSVHLAKSYGLAPLDGFQALAQDASGILVAGLHDGQSTLDSLELSHVGGQDIFIGKLDATLTAVWARAYGTGADEAALHAALDPAGNLIVTGTYAGAGLDLGKGALPFVAPTETFVAKLSSSDGTTLWARELAGGLDQLPGAVTTYANGDVLVGVNTGESITIDNMTTNAQADDIVLVRLNAADGSRHSAFPFGDPALQRVQAVATGANDAALFAGDYQGQLGGISLQPATATDGFVAMVDPNFAPVWSVRFGGNGDQQVHAIAAGGSHLWAVGSFTSGVVVDGGPSLSTGFASEGFVAKLSLEGAVDKLVGLGAQSVVRDVVLVPDGGAVIAGEFQGTLALGSPPLTANAGWAWFVARLDATGQPSWSSSVGNDEHNVQPRLASGAGATVIVGGTFQGSVTLGNFPITTNGFDPLAIAICP